MYNFTKDEMKEYTGESLDLHNYWSNYERCKIMQLNMIHKLFSYTKEKLIASDVLVSLFPSGRICFVFDEEFLPYPCPSVVLSMSNDMKGISRMGHHEESNSLGRNLSNIASKSYGEKVVSLLVSVPRGFEIPDNGDEPKKSTCCETTGEVEGFNYCVLRTQLDNIGHIDTFTHMIIFCL